MDLKRLLGEFKDGFQQSNRHVFRVAISPDLEQRIIRSQDAAATDITKGIEWLATGMLCDTTHIPDRSFDETQLTIYGFAESIPFSTNFTTLGCSFLLPLLNHSNPILKVFGAWMNSVQDIGQGLVSSRNFAFPDDYYTTAFLHIFDRNDQPTITYAFERLYPRSIESVATSWAEESEFSRLNVTFRFSAWKIVEEPSPIPLVPIPTTRTFAASAPTSNFVRP